MKIALLLICLIVIPFCLGGLFYDREEGRLLIFVKGILIQWGILFAVAVPFIITHKSFSLLLKVYIPVVLMLAIAGLLLFADNGIRWKKSHEEAWFFTKPVLLSGAECFYLAVFLGIWLFQMYKTLCYAFVDGDDAYYVALANVINSSDTLYTINPYTGVFSDVITYRYALAPFPVWIAALSRITGINVATMAHVIINVTLITITYVIYGELAKLLFKKDKEKQYMFLSFLAVFAVFSNVSQSMAETFMLTRTRQGKEALANIIIPFMFLCFLKLATREEFRVRFRDMCLMLTLTLAGALTSLFANVLLCIGYGLFFLYSFYRRSSLKSRIYMIIPTVPALLIMLMYWRLA